MKKLWLMLLLSSTIATATHAQVFDDDQDGMGQGRLKEMHEEFINNYLGLNRDEAVQFWGLFDDFQNERQKIRRKYRIPTDTDLRGLSEAEAAKLVQSRVDMEDEIQRAKKTYLNRLRDAIPSKKLVLYPEAERAFKRQLLERVRDARPGNRRQRRF